MKVFTADYSGHAGHWIYKGIQKAWSHLGYDVHAGQDGSDPNSPGPANTTWGCSFPIEWKGEYIIMTADGTMNNEIHLQSIERSYKSFIFVQPNSFPEPWGTHPNFITDTPDWMIDRLNGMKNVHLWTFSDETTSYHTKWKHVHNVPLAYDHLSYSPPPTTNKKYSYDICFIGGWVNNGFNEKKKIMIDIFSKFKNSGLKCGFFVGKNLSHEQECEVMYNSKVTLNIHDAYQRILGYDTNERTFKSLGLNGCLVSDTVGQLNRLFPQVRTSLDSDELVKITQEYLSLSEGELENIKEENRQNIIDHHCYTHRIEQMLKFKNE